MTAMLLRPNLWYSMCHTAILAIGSRILQLTANWLTLAQNQLQCDPTDPCYTFTIVVSSFWFFVGFFVAVFLINLFHCPVPCGCVMTSGLSRPYFLQILHTFICHLIHNNQANPYLCDHYYLISHNSRILVFFTLNINAFQHECDIIVLNACFFFKYAFPHCWHMTHNLHALLQCAATMYYKSWWCKKI